MDQTWTPIIIDGILMESHPEQKPGEVWLTNCDGDEPDDFDCIGYQTKRAGQRAYDKDGKVVSRCFPVFVSTAEYNKVMGDVNKVEIGH
ncbi:MAG: hypothetical protein UW75_C0018G0004 [Parcubacteria group bacterium GW2011_GWF2_44_8]|nr:MAG: hypothetical protein UW75_C0018G0004 [Parcubacteria group bacterium GW2011_GWF2_44_8]